MSLPRRLRRLPTPTAASSSGLWPTRNPPLGEVGVDKRTADVADIQHAHQAGVADDWQVAEVAAAHERGRVRDAGRRVDEGRAGGHQVMDPGLFEVFAVRYRVGNVFLGNDAYRLAGVKAQDHEGARARVLHEVGGRGRVVVLVCRREWWPHDVRDDGRGGWLSGLL